MGDTTTGYLVERLETPDGHRDSVYSVAFAPNGRDLVSGSLDKTIKLWELNVPRGYNSGSVKPGKCVRTFEGHKDFVLSVCLTPDGHWVMSGSKDRGVQFWDPVTGNAQMMLQGHKNSVISVAPVRLATCSLLAVVTCGHGSGDTRRTLDGDGILMIGSFGASVTLGVILFVRSALCLCCFFIFSNHFF